MSKQPAKPVLYTSYVGGFFDPLPIREDLVKTQLSLKEITLGKDRGIDHSEAFIYLESKKQHFKVHSLLFPDGERWDAYNGWNEGAKGDVSYYQSILKSLK